MSSSKDESVRLTDTSSNASMRAVLFYAPGDLRLLETPIHLLVRAKLLLRLLLRSPAAQISKRIDKVILFCWHTRLHHSDTRWLEQSAKLVQE